MEANSGTTAACDGRAGEMAARIRAFDWSGTPAGARENWPQSLRTAVDIILDAPLAMIVLWGPDLIQIYNDGYRDLMAAKHPAGLGQPTQACWPEVWSFNAPVYDAVWRGERRSFEAQELTVRRRDVEERAWFDLSFSPLRDERGDVAGVLVTVIEITGRVAVDLALRESEARLREAAEGAGFGIFDADLVAGTVYWSPEMRDLLGQPRDTPPPSPLQVPDFVHPDDRAAVERLFRSVEDATTDGLVRHEHRICRPDGEVRWVHMRGQVLFADHPGGRRAVRVSGIVLDVTDRKRAEERQALLLAELDHRVKNVLAVVQAIAHQSLRTSDPEAASRFVGRIAALARSHTLLAEERWQGADLRRLVKTAAAPHQVHGGPPRLVLGGPRLQVSPKAAQTLGLAFHELATNASKHGALSVPGGRVSVDWSLKAEGGLPNVVLEWRETGGPTIAEQPRRRGFGTRLLEQSLRYELNGAVALDYRTTGLVATLTLPVASLVPSPSDAPPVPPPVPQRGRGTRRRRLAGKRVLVVEDQHMIAREIADALSAAGCDVVGPAPDLARAHRMADTESPDAAVLDVNLGGELVWPLAEALRDRAVPVVLATGYADSVVPPQALRDVPRLAKPFDGEALLEALASQL